MRLTGLFLFFALWFSSYSILQAAEFFVATAGKDSDPGTQAKPFASLERARDAVRAWKKSGTANQESVTVWIQPGTYPRTRSFELTSVDSGTEKSPVFYRANNGGEVRLDAGRVITVKDFSRVTNPTLVARIDKSAQGKVGQLDLAKLGLKNIKPFPPVFNHGSSLIELYFNGKRMLLSRWPNRGFVTMESVVDRGDWGQGPSRHGGKFIARETRPERWRVESGVWLEGYWRVPWDPVVAQVQAIDPATREITFAEPINGGIGSKYAKKGELGDGKEPWCAVNLLEEIDQPGEWCVEFPTKTLFLWPPGYLSSAKMFLADFDQPLVTMRDVSHVTLRGLVFESSLGNGVEINGGTSNQVAGCTFRNLGGSGVIINGGLDHGVRSSDFHDLGHGGIYMSGGNRQTLSPAKHFAENNHLHHLGIRKKTYAAAIHVGAYGTGDAVGCRVTHNFIHDMPHAAILYGGNDHLFEFNEVARVALTSGDVGAFYTWHDWTSRGNVLRHNFVYDSPGANAFYIDDGDSGDSVIGNVVYRCSYGPFIGGGHDNEVRNNLIIESERALHLDSRGVSRGYATNQTLLKRLQSASAEQPPWSTRYPTLSNLIDGRRDLPTGNRFLNNVAVDCTTLLHLSGKKEELAGNEMQNNISLSGKEAGLIDPAKLDFRLSQDSEVFRKLPDFQPIPFEKIGLMRDEDRTSLTDIVRTIKASSSGTEAFDSNTDVQRTNDR